MQDAKGRGYGKVILFGEHFVVYGLPGIASGIDKYVEIKAEKVKDLDDIIINDPLFFKEKVSIKESPDHIKSRGFVTTFKDEEDVPKKGIKITYGGNLSPGGGLGFSAALAVAAIRAINNLFDFKWKDEKINELAYKWEIVAHGTPSGIDNTCATYGSLVWFEKDLTGGKNKVRPFKVGSPLFLVIGDSGVSRPTSVAVAAVKKWKEENESEAKKIFAEAKKIVGKAKTALTYGETEEIGKLMNQNNELLVKIGVSHPELDQMIKLALCEGALGAKITGAGCGGNMIALCENEKYQDKVVAALNAKGYKTVKTKIS